MFLPPDAFGWSLTAALIRARSGALPIFDVTNRYR
jgi:hypothetical protein